MIKNLSEEHVFAAYDRLRPSFPQFCGCDMCRGDVLIYALNRVQARYVNTLAGSVMTELNLEKDQSRAQIEVLVMEGLRKVDLAPRCGRKPSSGPFRG
ncbi:MAG TPA: late competence development ComFB family protein [Gemmatimonadales bacterium]|nr:late competence development ComFB family protein [Gemmatimonadales bacterium]